MVTAVTREDVEAFMHDIAAGKTASKTKTKPREARPCRQLLPRL
jgi:hypothetical protein